MNLTRQQIERIPIHFILCTERTGSSLLSLMLNISPKVLSPSEEPFALFLYDKYKYKTSWTTSDIKSYVDDFWLIAEKDINLFFTTKQKLTNVLETHKLYLNYQLLIRITYLHFLEPKSKDAVNCIVDKQIKYFFYLKKLVKIFPESKFVILVRDPRVNAIRKKNRNLNTGKNPLYLAALWNNTYKNINYLLSKQKAVLIVKYEDLVSEPEKTLREVCEFIEVDYTDSLIKTEGIYESFLNIQKEKVDKNHIAYLTNFQSSLFGKIDKEKIHLQENEMNVELHNKIVKLTAPLLNKFNYNINQLSSAVSVKFTINDYWQLLKSWLYRPFLIVFYLHIPIPIKLFIKRLKNKS